MRCKQVRHLFVIDGDDEPPYLPPKETVFYRIPRGLLRRKEVSPRAKLVYAYLNFSPNDGFSIRPLAKEIGSSPQSVYRALKELESFHLLHIDSNATGSSAILFDHDWLLEG